MKLPAEVREALEAVIAYSWEHEQKDAQEQLRENGDLEGHIFPSLVVLDNFVNGITKRPEDYLDEEP
jgi:hypothetical protein